MKSSLQKGNVIVFVLIGVALFGALIFSFIKSSQENQQSLTDLQISLTIQEFFNDMNVFSKTIDKLRQRGCSEDQISFENSTNLNYSNPNAPVDKSCHLFDAAGGGLNWKTLAVGSVNKDYLFSGYYAEQWGATARDGELYGFVLDVPLNICRQVNQEAGSIHLPNIPRELGLPITPQRYFVGTYFFYPLNCNDAVGFCNSSTLQYPYLCVESAAPNRYALYYRLLSRP